ncbi:hypothetical protein NRV59_002255 [Staphylococcus pseudintermedius]|nr:hypothetical protein [Staphylococcus pseudintermedius]EJO7194549.1 hypothetical protein [Staphylococcus pseudintermedius]HCA7520424.1 hypothetical protein [Staphylococcus pseudintermedius]
MRGTIIVNNTQQYLEELEREATYAKQMVSETTAKVNELYHDIETRNFNAYEAWILCKELQNVLQERRAWKQRCLEAKESFNDLGGKKKLNQLKRRQKNRVNKFMKLNSWFDHFSDEAKEIMAGNTAIKVKHNDTLVKQK